ncbi:MAG: hypothetical protein AAGU04_01135 [Anaerolineaceae bacterium]
MVKSNLFRIGLVTVVVMLIAAACAPALTQTPTEKAPTATDEVATEQATNEPTVVPTESPIAFDKTAAEEEGYWYSRYNMGNLAMMSGLGDTFMPEMSMIEEMIKMVDSNPDDGDVPMPPVNASLLTTVYASGDPHYTQAVDMMDFGTQRWDPSSFDKTITPRAMGWLTIKEIEWAKQFHVDGHFGTPSDNFGAQWRFVGMVITAEAKMQTQYALEMLMNEQGLFANSDGSIDNVGQWVMLEALSDMGGALGAEALPNSESNRYYDEMASGMFLGAADTLFGALGDRQPADVEEYSLAIQALTWYAANTTNAENKAAAIIQISDFGNALSNIKTANATENAFVIRGLIEAYRVSGDTSYLTTAAASYDALYKDFNFENGVFNSQSKYTIDDIGVLLGGINSVILFAGNKVDLNQAEELFTAVFLNLVNKSGLQQSVPPVEAGKDKFEQDNPLIYYGYPTLPMPPMAGGDFGIAPVFAAEITYTSGGWEITDPRFDAAGAMHTSNEFIWFHNDEVNGFPEIVQ